METRVPTSRGTLEHRPLAHLLVYSHLREMTGSFVFACAGATATLFISAGRPSKLKTTHEAVFLGRVLLEMGAISQAEHDSSLRELAKGGRLHGQILLERGAITALQLREALATQLARNVDALFRLPQESTFEYYADVDLLEGYGGAEKVHVDPMARVWVGLREQPPWAHVEPAIEKLRQGKLRISKTAQLDRLALRPEDRRVIELLRVRPMHVDDIVANAEGLGEKGAKLLAYFLAITKQVDLVAEVADLAGGEEEEPSWVGRRPVPTPSRSGVQKSEDAEKDPSSSSKMAAVSASPASPARALGRVSLKKPTGGAVGPIEEKNESTTPDRRLTPPPGEVRAQSDPLLARRQEILDRAATLETHDFFQILGVAQDAPANLIKETFFGLAKRWHPDRLPQELGDLRDQVSRIFARMSEANATLTDEAKRKSYVQARGEADSPEAQQEVAAILQASLNYQKAEICLKRNDIAQAEDLARRAHLGDPKQADYLALLAWLEAMKPDAQTPEATMRKIAMLDQAIQLNDKCERGYFYRGMLNKRSLREGPAHQDFKRVMELNPKNIDAQREVRLYEMRGATRPAPAEPPKGAGGLLGRLFKKG